MVRKVIYEIHFKRSHDLTETMSVETAAARYDVVLSTLRTMCTRGDVESRKVGKRRYVTKAAMDKVFKGEVAAEPNATRAPK